MVGRTFIFWLIYFSTNSNTVISPPDRDTPFAKSRSRSFSFSLNDRSGFFPSGNLSFFSSFQLYRNFLFFVIGSMVLYRYLPSALCCSPNRKIRFLSSLIFLKILLLNSKKLEIYGKEGLLIPELSMIGMIFLQG